MKQIIIAAFLLLGLNSIAQNDSRYVEGLAKDYVAELRTQGVDTLFVRAYMCEGSVKRFMLRDGSWCTSNGSYIDAAVLHMKDGEAFITKIDNCGMFKPVQIESSELFDLYTAQEQTLKNEQIKDYETDVEYDEPKSRTEVYNCRWAYVFFEGEEEFKSRYEELQLTNDPEHPNKNYEYNNNHPLVALEGMIQTTIANLETQGKFSRK